MVEIDGNAQSDTSGPKNNVSGPVRMDLGICGRGNPILNLDPPCVSIPIFNLSQCLCYHITTTTSNTCHCCPFTNASYSKICPKSLHIYAAGSSIEWVLLEIMPGVGHLSKTVSMMATGGFWAIFTRCWKRHTQTIWGIVCWISTL